jgi:DNA-binding CsgD family transcriptional regulator/catechol 2,3-dioxygenase-like lactoylglutathione lyase family enzyme
MTSTKERGRPRHGDVLTPGEWRVAEAVRHGLTNRDIATRLGVSIDAVKFHVSNILTKLALTRRSQLRTWRGVRNDSELAKRDAERPFTSLGSIGQVSRSVKDVAKATKWYRDILGLPLLYAFEKLSFFDCNGTRLMLTTGEVSAQAILYFQVESIQAAHADLARRGVQFISAPHMIHRHADGAEEWMAFFNDCDGQPLAIMSQVKPMGD